MALERINPEDLPRPETYTQVVIAKGTRLVFVSGQEPEDVHGRLVGRGDLSMQARQVFANLVAVLKAAGTSMDQVVKATVFLRHMADFTAMNEIYAEHLGKATPARSTVAVTELPRGALVEIDLIAVL